MDPLGVTDGSFGGLGSGEGNVSSSFSFVGAFSFMSHIFFLLVHWVESGKRERG